ncbi:hypothetical protein [Solirubrum puertoriconensis]|uniref:Uncharacterized protein n=1 Tax=Solirubrum puertoriconensis TaxID=1751427 RepID=A0A9X0L5R6_SOLP1|nr:hypothetical protein [Solirubrum puertoriconensis]KUG09023.1 hypothetical protein ASU33_19560 [Solirubrum puertoriconensis]
MTVALPIPDCPLEGLQPVYPTGCISTTQSIVEQVMQLDFPELAARGLEAYANRLLRVDYPDSTSVFYLDWTIDLPGYTLCYLEPWTSEVGPDGGIYTNIRYYRGPEAARRAEAIRRSIPPEA